MRAYESEGYDYFSLSEHDTLLPDAELQPYTHMCILQAVEVTSFYNQTLMYLGAVSCPQAQVHKHIGTHAHVIGSQALLHLL
jgi:hypothetical protein